MNAVGIDVSKGKSMVTILRPFGEIVSSPFEIKHTSSDILSLIKLIHSIEGESQNCNGAHRTLLKYLLSNFQQLVCLSVFH